MDRKQFIKICGLFGIGWSLQSLTSCNASKEIAKPYSGKVVVIGAGAGGLSAGYFLKQQGTDFEILEASTIYGGRIRIDRNFANFPIPLGAEWLETSVSIFSEIVNDAKVEVNINTVPDNPDRKFVDYSWFSFFEDYILPSISNHISYQTVVKSIDYSGNQIIVTTNKGEVIADKVVLSIPLQVLKAGDVDFIPSLPQSKINALNDAAVWDGFKAFFEFDSKFYGDNEFEFQIEPKTDGQKIYYNACLGQNTSKNIIGLFAIGKPAQDYISRSGESLKKHILDELDSIYANKATPSYLNHITQNWNNEPFIRGGYLTDYADWRTVRELGNNVGSKLFFAGSEYTDGEDWVSVHTAAQSAKRAVMEINI